MKSFTGLPNKTNKVPYSHVIGLFPLVFNLVFWCLELVNTQWNSIDIMLYTEEKMSDFGMHACMFLAKNTERMQ